MQKKMETAQHGKDAKKTKQLSFNDMKMIKGK